MHFSRQDVEQRILQGETLIIYRGGLIRVPTTWLAKHPGGSLALLHFVGRDASDEIEAYHSGSALELLKRFIVGTVELDKHEIWHPFVPPVMSGWVRRDDAWFNEAAPISISDAIPSEILLVKSEGHLVDSSPTPATLQVPQSSLDLSIQAQHSTAYRTLHERVVRAGLYQTPYLTGYGPEVLRYIALASLSAYAYVHDWQVLSALFLGFMWHQLVFTVHDLGHMGVTHDWKIDRLVSIFLADFVGGLSVGWWVEVSMVSHFLDSWT